jgi:hypothetical protein
MISFVKRMKSSIEAILQDYIYLSRPSDSSSIAGPLVRTILLNNKDNQQESFKFLIMAIQKNEDNSINVVASDYQFLRAILTTTFRNNQQEESAHFISEITRLEPTLTSRIYPELTQAIVASDVSSPITSYYASAIENIVKSSFNLGYEQDIAISIPILNQKLLESTAATTQVPSNLTIITSLTSALCEIINVYNVIPSRPIGDPHTFYNVLVQAYICANDNEIACYTILKCMANVMKCGWCNEHLIHEEFKMVMTSSRVLNTLTENFSRNDSNLVELMYMVKSSITTSNSRVDALKRFSDSNLFHAFLTCNTNTNKEQNKHTNTYDFALEILLITMNHVSFTEDYFQRIDAKYQLLEHLPKIINEHLNENNFKFLFENAYFGDIDSYRNHCSASREIVDASYAILQLIYISTQPQHQLLLERFITETNISYMIARLIHVASGYSDGACYETDFARSLAVLLMSLHCIRLISNNILNNELRITFLTKFWNEIGTVAMRCAEEYVIFYYGKHSGKVKPTNINGDIAVGLIDGIRAKNRQDVLLENTNEIYLLLQILACIDQDIDDNDVLKPFKTTQDMFKKPIYLILGGIRELRWEWESGSDYISGKKSGFLA